ncbi:hypothetical protein Tco_1571221 [Tanacetum coccineum]
MTVMNRDRKRRRRRSTSTGRLCPAPDTGRGRETSSLTTPPPSPLTPLSSPLPHIPSPLFPASPPASVLPASPPASPIRLLGYRAAMIWLRAETPSTSHPLPLPTPSPPLQYEIGESSAAAATRPIGGRRADYGFVGTMDTEIRRQRAKEVGYGIRDVWVDPREAVEEVAPMTLGGVNARVTELTTVQEQTRRILCCDRGYTGRQTPDISKEVLRHCLMNYMTRSEIMALRSVVMGQQAVISQLQAADRRSQVVTSEMLQADHQRQVQLTKALKLLKGLQTQMAEFQRQLGPAKGPAQPDAPGEASSMAPKRRTTRLNPGATPTPVTDTHTTTSVTKCPTSAILNDGVTAALVAHDVTRMAMIASTLGTLQKACASCSLNASTDFLKLPTLELQGH